MQRGQTEDNDRLHYSNNSIINEEIRFFPPASSTFVEVKAAQKNRTGLIRTDEDQQRSYQVSDEVHLAEPTIQKELLIKRFENSQISVDQQTPHFDPNQVYQTARQRDFNTGDLGGLSAKTLQSQSNN